MKKRIIFISTIAAFGIIFIGLKISHINLVKNAVIVMDVKSKYDKDNYSYLYSEPILRTISSQANNEDKNIIKYDKVTFFIPWQDFMQEKKYEDEKSLGVFSDKEAVYIFKQESIEKRVDEIINSTDKEKFLNFYEGILKDEYKLKKQIFMSNPDKISFSKSYNENLGEKVFLTLKDMQMTIYQTNKILEFETENIKGFQYREILDGTVSCNIDFYDNKGNMYSMLIHHKNLKQKDIDYILSSIEIE